MSLPSIDTIEDAWEAIAALPGPNPAPIPKQTALRYLRTMARQDRRGRKSLRSYFQTRWPLLLQYGRLEDHAGCLHQPARTLDESQKQLEAEALATWAESF